MHLKLVTQPPVAKTDVCLDDKLKNRLSDSWNLLWALLPYRRYFCLDDLKGFWNQKATANFVELGGAEELNFLKEAYTKCHQVASDKRYPQFFDCIAEWLTNKKLKTTLSKTTLDK